LIAAFQTCFGDALAVNKRPIRRTKIAQKTARGCDLQQTMMTREKLVLWQTQVGVVSSSYQKCVGLGEAEDAAFVGTR
jgi:hypothetical protein